MTLSLSVTVLLWITVALVGYMAWMFATNPERGLQVTTHRFEKLPYVMANRYTSFAILGVGMILFGDYRIIAVYFLSGAIMALSDGVLYARAGQSYIRHLASGTFSILATIVSSLAWVTTQAGGGSS